MVAVVYWGDFFHPRRIRSPLINPLPSPDIQIFSEFRNIRSDEGFATKPRDFVQQILVNLFFLSATLPETNSSYLKMDGLEDDCFILGRPNFGGELLVSGRVMDLKDTVSLQVKSEL